MLSKVSYYNAMLALERVQGTWNEQDSTWDIGDQDGKSLKVSSVQYTRAPFLYRDSDFVSSPRLTGPHVTALSHICQAFQYRCQILQAPLPDMSPNGSLGVLQDVVSGRAEVGLDSMTVNPARIPAVDLVVSPFSRVYQAIIHENNVIYTVSIESSILHVFQLPVWLLVLTTVLWFVSLLALMDMFWNRFVRGRYRSRLIFRVLTCWTLNLCGADRLDSASVRQNGLGTVHRGELLWAQYCLLCGWMLSLIIASGILSSRLLGSMENSGVEASPFVTVEELVQSDFMVYGSANMITLFHGSPIETLWKLGDRMVKIPANGDDYLPFVAGILRSGRTAVVIAEENHADLARLSCGIVVAIPEILAGPLSGFMLRKNSSLLKGFQDMYNHLVQMGIVQAEFDYFTRLFGTRISPRCFPRRPAVVSPENFYPTNWLDVRILFYILWSAHLGAALLFSCEYCGILRRLSRWFRSFTGRLLSDARADVIAFELCRIDVVGLSPVDRLCSSNGFGS